MWWSVLPFLFPSALAAQPAAPAPIRAPLRDLDIGQLNFLHTTDTHGWLAGHLQEPSFSADWGDYVSFAAHMREKIEAQGRDLLVIDTGDRVEGNGLYDSSEPKGVYLREILRHQHVDVMTSGNHELYKQNTSEAELLVTVPCFKGSYLASNIDIYHPKTEELVPLAPRYKKFTTKQQGIRIVAFGFLFDFTGNYNNTVVQRVEETIKEDWFQEAIRDKEVDLFLVAGHVPARSPEYKAIFTEIRSIRWDTPIQFFGGHEHIRDYTKYDSKAVALASGRFMETVGFMSIDGLSTSEGPSTAAGPVFKRRYIDNNLHSYYHHTGLDEDSFPTEKGRNVSRLIAESRNALQLDKIHGCAPRDLWMSRVPYPHNDSVYTWLEKQVLADSLEDESRGDGPAVAILNTGAIRFDIFEGPFTQDTTWIISPFTNGFRYVKDVPYDKVQLIMEVLNQQTKVMRRWMDETDDHLDSLGPPAQLEHTGDVIADADESHDWPAFDMVGTQQIPLAAKKPSGEIVPGYTTQDDAGDDGDDSIHSPISFYRVPNCIQALVSVNASTALETVDLIYIDFIEPYLTLAAKFAQLDVDFAKEGKVYLPGKTMTDVILDWVKANWKCE
ncbi:hypothetical protein N7532_001247 [Penicillium argentinense]|uniref:Calcineurin-like phosphoesterase domain-containing protein n=1 Tax=Penicillium argentinense TaxID=1131581 RepID=A0A9W9G274_9EURO|nr:uncharacterized protein N7532_001247 [Penicillium argentinense]KAJ5110712.1 hypothetical protein N7532_001247 [Penicillium argentinense]